MSHKMCTGTGVLFTFCFLELKPTRMCTVISFISRSRPHLAHQRSVAIHGKKLRPIYPTKWKAPALDGTVRAQTAEPLVCYTAVFSVVTQGSSWGGALRDDNKNGCVAD